MQDMEIVIRDGLLTCEGVVKGELKRYSEKTDVYVGDIDHYMTVLEWFLLDVPDKEIIRLRLGSRKIMSYRRIGGIVGLTGEGVRIRYLRALSLLEQAVREAGLYCENDIRRVIQNSSCQN